MDLYNMAVLLKEVDSPSFIALHIVYHLSMIAITVRDSWAFVLYYLLTAHATFCCSEPYLAHHELESVITIIFVTITFTTVAVIIVVVIVVIIIIIEKYI